MFIKSSDGSITDENGKVLFFSVERFISDIVDGDCCFVCGAKPSVVNFNDEHILPQWILKKYDLRSKSITLPNEASFRYDRYKIPCCEQCNSHMARALEEPTSKLITLGSRAISEYLREYGPWHLFCWLALIFIKTHLKDKELRFHRDRRQESGNVSDFYDWAEFHHVHCIARSFYTGCILESSVLGTLFVLPAKTKEPFSDFDFAALYSSQSMLLQLGEVAFITVFNDSGAAFSLFKDKLQQISAPLSQMQLREILAIVAHINLHLKKRPIYTSNFNPFNGTYSISAQVQSVVELEDYSLGEYGALLHYCCRDILPEIKEEFGMDIEEALKEGRWTFLFDQNDRFIESSI
jgi:hypothetical protein